MRKGYMITAVPMAASVWVFALSKEVNSCYLLIQDGMKCYQWLQGCI